jgi:hypothetical protein
MEIPGSAPLTATASDIVVLCSSALPRIDARICRDNWFFSVRRGAEAPGHREINKEVYGREELH